MTIEKYHRACLVLILAAAITLMLNATSGWAHEREDTACRMTFSMEGWSALYQTASGYGTISCTNGQHSRVWLKMKGGGLTAGKYRLHGKGDFTGVRRLSDVYGTYAATDAHAGVVRSANAQIMTKGTVSLAIASKGRGNDLGVGFSGFTIEPAARKR